MVLYTMLPALTRDVKAELHGPKGVSKEVLDRAWAFRRKLFEIQREVDTIFSDASIVQELIQPNDEEDPFETYFWFDNIIIAQTLSLYWRLVIAINCILQHISTSMSRGGFSHDTRLSDSSLAVAEHLLKSVRYARAWRPLGSVVLLVALPLAYSVYAGEPCIQRWILRAINEFSEPLNDTGRRVLTKMIDAIEILRDNGMEDHDFLTLKHLDVEKDASYL